MLHDSTSLVKTLDLINEKFLYGEAMPQEEALEAARWITTQQGKKGSYRGLFAPTTLDFDQGIRLFTGERLLSASARHIMGQEAARAAWLLGCSDPVVRQAYDRATAWIHEAPEFQNNGTYCCARCTLAFWRHFWVGNFESKESLIGKGLQCIKDLRLGDGKWRRFPFFYAIYTLLDLDLNLADAELLYARPVMEKYVKQLKAGVYAKRRLTIIEKALERVS